MRLQWNEHEIEKMLRDPVLRSQAMDTAAAVADLARGMAPRDTGAGADSLTGTARYDDADDVWALVVGADQLHAYMRFPDRGTRYITAQRFLERAAQQVTQRGG